MSPADAVRSVLRSYARFSGRARRSEYWWWSLAYTVVFVAYFVLIGLLAAVAGESEPVATAAGLVYLALVAAVVVPSVAVTVRRLHDTGRSGWWYLICFAPLGGIALLVFTCMDSQQGTNVYGPSPKLPSAATYA